MYGSDLKLCILRNSRCKDCLNLLNLFSVLNICLQYFYLNTLKLDNWKSFTYFLIADLSHRLRLLLKCSFGGDIPFETQSDRARPGFVSHIYNSVLSALSTTPTIRLVSAMWTGYDVNARRRIWNSAVLSVFLTVSTVLCIYSIYRVPTRAGLTDSHWMTIWLPECISAMR